MLWYFDGLLGMRKKWNSFCRNYVFSLILLPIRREEQKSYLFTSIQKSYTIVMAITLVATEMEFGRFLTFWRMMWICCWYSVGLYHRAWLRNLIIITSSLSRKLSIMFVLWVHSTPISGLDSRSVKYLFHWAWLNRCYTPIQCITTTNCFDKTLFDVP